MKQKIYIFGVVIALVVFTGIIFKVNHFAGAGLLLILGMGTLVLFFIPAALINHYRSEENRQNLLLHIVTWLTCLVVFTAMLFKIQHWSGASVLLTIALPFPYIVFLPVFLITTARNKNFSIYNTVFVLLLLALNSVFSTMLALNVTRLRINDSFLLSHNYNNLETALSRFSVTNPQSPVSLKIDEVLKIAGDYQTSILNYEGITVDQWRKDQRILWRPDERNVAAKALVKAGESSYGSKLQNGLNGLITLMENTPGYEELAKDSRLIFDLTPPSGNEAEWAIWKFNQDYLAWVLIYLDGLKANLQMIKVSV